MESVSEILFAVLNTVLVLLAIGLGTERGTEVVKQTLRLAGSKFAWLDFRGRKSFVLATVVAFFITYFFNVDATQYLQLLDGFDPELVKLVNALLLTFFANQIHDRTNNPIAEG